MQNDPEYQALVKFIRADKWERIFRNALVLVCFALFVVVIVQFLQLRSTITNEVRGVIEGQKQLVIDAQKESRTRTEESRGYITCMFLIPVEQRTVENQLFCFEKSDLPGGRDNSEFTPIEIGAADFAVATGAGVSLRQPSEGEENVDTSYSNDTPAPTATQPEYSQPTTPAPSEPQPSPSLLDGVTSAVGGTVRGVLDAVGL